MRGIRCSFKLQFNTLEISSVFYDKVRTLSEKDFTDVVNKRVGVLLSVRNAVEHV